jgi:hypothetical protein
MKFKDISFSRENRFSIGIEEESGRYFLSIPVGNNLVSYEEYYEISKCNFNKYHEDMTSAHKFVEECRERLHDKLLMEKPPKNRGNP